MLLTGLPDACAGCVLSDNQKCGHFTKVTGRGSTGVLIVGEASGEHEAFEGTPFVTHAPSGSILEKAIKLTGGQRDDYWITNILRCRPPNNVLAGASYEQEAINHCSEYLRGVIRSVKPRAIIALGAIPTRELTGYTGGKRSISYVRGFPLVGPDGITVVPSFHPAFIARGNTRLLSLLVKDLMTARSAAAGRIKPIIDPSKEMDAEEGLYALEQLYNEALSDPDLWIAYDIETERSVKGAEDELVEFEYQHTEGIIEEIAESGSLDVETLADGSDERVAPLGPASIAPRDARLAMLDTSTNRIISIQFAISDKRGVYINWGDERARELAKRVLELPNPKIGWNSDLFDNPILRRHGVTLNGPLYDGLPMRRALQPDLPAGLQQTAVDYGWRFPWKHESGVNAVFYGVCDVCSLVRITARLPMELERLGMWEGYNRFIREVREKILGPWEQRGIPMSRDRLDEFRIWLGEEIGSQTVTLLSHVPEELRGKHPKVGYKVLPADIKEILDTHELIIDTPKSRRVAARKLLIGTEFFKEAAEFLGYKVGEFEDGAIRPYKEVPFNPRSSKQMIAYIKFRGWEVPKTFKDGKDTTSDKMLKRLEGKTKDPVIARSREIRVMEKMRDSYTGKLGEDGIARGGWIPDADGRLRTRALTKATWQFASVSPNVFTLPKRRGELAKQFRRCMAAEPGHVLIEVDFRAFHDLTTAALASDERKWRTAKIDPHSYVAAWLVKYPGVEKALDLSDADLTLYLKEVRSKHEKVRDEQAKPLNHGTNFGQSYRRLYFENEEYFESEAQAKALLLMLKRVYPKTFAWQEQLLESLDAGNGRTPYLQSVWGARRWFWDVWVWKKDRNQQWYRAKGQDAEKALAYLPSNNAHGMFRMKMLEMAELDWLERYELVGFPHDAMWFHPPKELSEECIHNVREWLEAPVMELANPILCPNGFSCGVDVQVGLDMGSMEKVK